MFHLWNWQRRFASAANSVGLNCKSYFFAVPDQQQGEIMSTERSSDFERMATGRRGGNLLSEIWGFLRQRKKWWLLPILLILSLFGAILLLSGTGAAPFIYTLF